MKTQLKKNEKVIITIRKHWFVFFLPILWTVILLIIAAAAAVVDTGAEFENYFLYGAGLIASITTLWFIYKILERNNNLWTVTNLRIIDEYGVFTNNSKETPLDKINNVTYRQTFSGRLFNYGNVQIQSAAESGATTHKMVERPRVLKDTITQYQERYKQEQIKEQAQKLAIAFDREKHSSRYNLTEEITKLYSLKEKGIITEADFQKGKDKILNN